MMELKELWRKQKLKGVFVQTVDSPAMPLIAQQAGMDFIFYDCEHGSFTYDKLTNLILLGNGRGFPSIVRVAQLARADVSGILDCGASGVMVPMMETKEQADYLKEYGCDYLQGFYFSKPLPEEEFAKLLD